MDPASAPLFDDVAGGPPGGAAWWLRASDRVRIRIGCWRPEGAARGTVLLFPGRTEYVEKYGAAAADLAARGFATLAVDWRGQGLADRLLDDPRPGYIGHFPDYQRDVAAVVEAATRLDLPKPLFLLAHSMGGCIGLRALIEGAPVQACAFTGPMWGIRMPILLRPAAYGAAYIGPLLGLGGRLMPSTKPDNYVEMQAFDGNALTTDPGMYAMMQAQLSAHPDLGLGGPSVNWMRASLNEMADLARRPAPALPCVTFLGTCESIVSAEAIRDRMAGWPGGHLDMVEGARHEVMMEGPEIRAQVFDRIAALFSQSGGTGS
ncbi:alpha/beta hydrolase [Antarcticimicrobium luteum]|uniref:Alpha/beta hydrolase n=1 Tax=Antarcticimicrobium luteum TaxID=2547397 RepID=A0A4R5VG15_9RHOB|nr:alpha/beta hydrolase [Antarcticimicrobium luteum]TDK51739.1 alpha/beta hydrolase [Antarcticimicrobium luteum]